MHVKTIYACGDLWGETMAWVEEKWKRPEEKFYSS